MLIQIFRLADMMVFQQCVINSLMLRQKLCLDASNACFTTLDASQLSDEKLSVCATVPRFWCPVLKFALIRLISMSKMVSTLAAYGLC